MSVAEDKRRGSIIRGLQYLRDSCQTLLVAVNPPDVDPDCDLDDLRALLLKVNPLVSEYMEASFGDGEDGG